MAELEQQQGDVSLGAEISSQEPTFAGDFVDDKQNGVTGKEDTKSPIRSRSRSPRGDSNKRHNERDRDRRGDRDRDRRRGSGRDRDSRRDRDRDRRGDSRNTSYRVFISNVPYEMKWQQIKDLFRDKIGEVTFVELFMDMDGKSKGCGVAEFRDRDTMEKCINKMHKTEIQGRSLVVKEDTDGRHSGKFLRMQERDNARSNMGGGNTGGRGMGRGPVGGGMGMDNLGGMGGMGGMGMGGVGGLGMGGLGGMGGGGGGFGGGGGGGGSAANDMWINPQILQQLGLEQHELTCTIVVSNLDFSVTWQKIKDVFRLAGNVIRADIKTTRDGKSRGMAIIEFESPREAVEAFSMFNGQKLFDREMRIRMDKLSREIKEPEPPLPTGLSGIGPTLSELAGSGSGMGGLGSSGFGGMGASGLGGLGGTGMGNLAMGANLSTSFGSNDAGMGFGNLGVSQMQGLGGYGSTGGSGGGAFGSGGFGSGMGSGMDSMGLGSGGYGSSSNMTGGYDDHRERGGRQGGCQIFVRNLPFSYTWQMLKDKFREFGRVMYAEIKMEGGKSKGCGTVRFESPDCAMRAINLMNGTRVDGREIDVRMDRA